MIVCQCSGVTERQIRRVVRAGACSTRDVARATGAGMSCGDCRSNVKKIVGQAIAKQLETGQSPQSTIGLTMAAPVEG